MFSIRNMKIPLVFRANNQLKSAVLALPKLNGPVGEGANRTRVCMFFIIVPSESASKSAAFVWDERRNFKKCHGISYSSLRAVGQKRVLICRSENSSFFSLVFFLTFLASELLTLKTLYRPQLPLQHSVLPTMLPLRTFSISVPHSSIMSGSHQE